MEIFPLFFCKKSCKAEIFSCKMEISIISQLIQCNFSVFFYQIGIFHGKSPTVTDFSVPLGIYSLLVDFYVIT